jgi:dTDP-4-dehydrorhamnose reductase
VDEYRTPLHAADAARVLIDLLVDQDVSGMHHLAGPERVSRWEFGQRFLRVHGLETELWSPAVRGDAKERAKDVSLISEWGVGRGLDEALAEA